MNETKDPRLILLELIESGNFPDDSFEIRHLERINDFEYLDSKRVRFWITRHPRLFGTQSFGMSLSAHIPIGRQYELDLDSKEVVLVKEEKHDPVIDFKFLAWEDVDFYFDGTPCSYEDELKNLKSENEVIAFAENEKKKFDFIHWYNTDEKLPDDFQEKISEALRQAYINIMLDSWRYNKKEENAG